MDTVRRVYEAAGRRDPKHIFALYDPEVELDARNLAPDLGVYHGHDGLRRLFAELRAAWSEIEYTYDELIDADEHVVSVVSRHVHGRSSGVPIEHGFALVWTVRDGQVHRVVWFQSKDEALKAAGLSE